MGNIYSTEHAINNLKNIMKKNNIKQSDICNFTGMAQGNVSNILGKKKKKKDGGLAFFTVEQLVMISNNTHISIDELLGIKNDNTKNVTLTARDICKHLLSMQGINMFLKPIEVTEECFYPVCDITTGMEEICHEKKTNNYLALYFSNWIHVESKDDFEEFYCCGNSSPRSRAINKFLERYSQIKKMKASGNLDDEMYNRLLESYLNDVPDK